MPKVLVLESGKDLRSNEFRLEVAMCSVVDGTVYPNSCNPCYFSCGNYCCVHE